MRSSAFTTVSRTSERIDSLRRRRRGRSIRSAMPRSLLVAEGIIFVVIFISVEKRACAFSRAEAAAGGAVSTVGTEVAAARDASLQPGRLLGLFAGDATPFNRRHVR